MPAACRVLAFRRREVRHVRGPDPVHGLVERAPEVSSVSYRYCALLADLLTFVRGRPILTLAILLPGF